MRSNPPIVVHTPYRKPSISPGLVIMIIIFIIIVYTAEVADKANINGRGRV